MHDTEWFCGKGVEDEESRTACSGAKRIAAMIFICGVGLALLGVIGGCASIAPAAPAVDNPSAEHSLVFRGESPDGRPAVLRIFTGKPCTDDRVLMFLVRKYGVPAEMLAQFKASILTWHGKDWASCWIEQQGYVVSVDEEGAPFQPVPKSKMRDEGV